MKKVINITKIIYAAIIGIIAIILVALSCVIEEFGINTSGRYYNLVLRLQNEIASVRNESCDEN